jgi:uncharacterized protein (DUF952 family)
MRLFHLARSAAWEAAERAGEYRAPSLDEVGFIHLSTRAQWLDTLVRFYRGASDLVLLEIDAALVHAPIRFEHADGDEFPHLYGVLPCAAVVAARPLPAIDERPVRIAATPAFEACVRAAEPNIADLAVCRASVGGTPTTYVCLGKRADAATVSLREIMRAEATLPAADRVGRSGWLVIGPFPRAEDGSVDEPWLLVTVQRLVASD